MPIPDKKEPIQQAKEEDSEVIFPLEESFSPAREPHSNRVTTTTSVASDDTNPSVGSQSDDAQSRSTDESSVDDESPQQSRNSFIEIPSDSTNKIILNVSDFGSNNPFINTLVSQAVSTSAPTSSSFIKTENSLGTCNSQSLLFSEIGSSVVEAATPENTRASKLTRNTLDSVTENGPLSENAYSLDSDSATSDAVGSQHKSINASSPIANRSRANTTSRYNYSLSRKPEDEVPSEVIYYRGAIECPICFLFYPKYLNLTRCCAQPICTECFVQIKRLDPHPPHDDHEDNDSNTPSSITPSESGSATSSSPVEPLLVSEPACCPYCMLPDFGVTFTSCHFRSGLEPSNGFKKMTPLSPEERSDKRSSVSSVGKNSSTSLEAADSTAASSTNLSKRRGSIPANAPGVITIDMIRPDWSLKLAAARARTARKSAQATAFHTSAFLMNGQREGSGSRRNRSGTSERRNRGSSNENSSTSGIFHTQTRGTRHRFRSLIDEAEAPASTNVYTRETLNEREAQEEQIRTEHLEDIMMREAIRLSLLDEEHRKAQEEEEKKRQKEESQASGSGGSISKALQTNREMNLIDL